MSILMALALAASSFDLNCTATKTLDMWTGLKREVISNDRVAFTMRIDLGRKLWCSGNCTSTSPIASVNDSKIVLHSSESEIGDAYRTVNRRTGALNDRERTFLPPTGMMVSMVNGTCEAAPFSGFPARKF